MSSTPKKKCCAASRNNDPEEKGITQNIEKRESPDLDTMVLIEGGTFLMGTDDGEGFKEDGEGPVREVFIDSFKISKFAVSNVEFKKFVLATGYITEAEQFGWSFVFHLFLDEEYKQSLDSPLDTQWWKAVPSAYWKQPEGLHSTIENRMDHPVVHISWNDAQAYCTWSGQRLPNEAEWELAARGGLQQKKYPWGNELTPERKHKCNIWQGTFPDINTTEDGFAGTCPVDEFEPNGFGLFNVAGNVWEWCSDWFSAFYPMLSIKKNPEGPGSGDAKVIRGGSYLCHKSYCNRYRVAARSANTPDSSTGNLGFRCVSDIKT